MKTKKIAWTAVLLLILIPGVFFSMSFYFFGYPHKVARNALASLRKGQALAKHKGELTQCTHLRATFMPALFYRCSVMIEYDRDLRIKGWSEPECWD